MVTFLNGRIGVHVPQRAVMGHKHATEAVPVLRRPTMAETAMEPEWRLENVRCCLVLVSITFVRYLVVVVVVVIIVLVYIILPFAFSVVDNK